MSAKVAAAVTTLIAIAAVVVALVALNKSKTTPISRSGPHLATLSTEVQSLKAEVTTLHALVSKGDAKLARLTTCLPELSGQINGLGVETSTVTIGERTFLTDAYLKDGKAVSSYCKATLETEG